MCIEHNTLLYPLDLLCANREQSLPDAFPVESQEIPEPYRSLLVHTREMTAVLEEYWEKPIRLRLLYSEVTPKAMIRHVALVDGRGRTVEFGSIHIHLEAFDEKPRREILECRVPLGTILRQNRMGHRNHPKGYFRIRPDALIGEILNLTTVPDLYGRHNLIFNEHGQLLAEVTEILPPLPEEGRGV